MIFVVGGGFGVYGHLAALAASGREVGAPSRYRQMVEQRPELRHVSGEVSWRDDEAQGLASATTVVLARRPADNAALALELCATEEPPALVIEKPIAPSASASIALAEQLDAGGCAWSTPYLFQYCDWYEHLASSLSGNGSATLTWRFRQGAAPSAWKSQPREGGGALAFYFIHCIALAEAALPGATMTFSRVEADGRQQISLVASRGEARLSIDFHLADEPVHFLLETDSGARFEAETPFGARPMAGAPDPRIAPLRRFYDDVVFGGRAPGAQFHARVHEHWRRLETIAGRHD
ncbi:MAG TPA: hypothetical protein VD906_09340 [Caulobacteraceae bacterium]|nr:hypothetical protein [Caulobacteraceae bacterium]